VSEYFGKQLRKERLKANLSILALAHSMRMDDAHLGRIERGIRPPTAEIAAKCDEAFPHREGWFTEYYEESRSWVPPAFKLWNEYEDRATRLLVWSPGVLDGLVQTADYARALLAVDLDVSDEVLTGRLTARLDRQRRVLHRDEPPTVWFIVDQLSLYRQVGSPEIMAEQLRRLVEVARRPHVTMTVMPAVEHPANESGFIIVDDAAYAESAAVGGVHQDQTLSRLTARFARLQAESFRASESVAMVEKVGAIWARGVNPLTAALAAASA
jgi:transcriptional regulator with XRE-family HTH domain